ncbi:MAG: hypothetical protein COA99_07655 [Moraxellaceae bacterium]|nr:MAG: hypothetical protein COA99_07655 [Moraxellaceae bacterium]
MKAKFASWSAQFAADLDGILTGGGIVLIGDDHNGAAAFDLATNLIVNTNNHSGKYLLVELSGSRASTTVSALHEAEAWKNGHPGGFNYPAFDRMLKRANTNQWAIRGIDINDPRTDGAVQKARQDTIAFNLNDYARLSEGAIVPYGSGHLKGVKKCDYSGLASYLADQNTGSVSHYDVDLGDLDPTASYFDRTRVVTIPKSCMSGRRCGRRHSEL